MKTTKVSGIYRITNKLNGKFYIGSAKNLANRFATHRKDLRKDQHHNTHLQAAWNKYGGDAFEFTVEEVVQSADLLFDREQFYLDSLKPYTKGIGYNKSTSARTSLGVKPSEETKVRQSEAAKRRFEREPQARGEAAHAAKLTQDKANAMMLRYQSGERSEDLAMEYGIGRRHLNDILHGKYWNNETFQYPIVSPNRKNKK